MSATDKQRENNFKGKEKINKKTIFTVKGFYTGPFFLARKESKGKRAGKFPDEKIFDPRHPIGPGMRGDLATESGARTFLPSFPSLVRTSCY